MQKSPCCTTVRAIVCDLFIAVTYFIAVDYNSPATIVVATQCRILHGVMHGISKTGPVHAKIRVRGIKRLTNSVVVTKMAVWTTLRLQSPACRSSRRRAPGSPESPRDIITILYHFVHSLSGLSGGWSASKTHGAGGYASEINGAFDGAVPGCNDNRSCERFPRATKSSVAV